MKVNRLIPGLLACVMVSSSAPGAGTAAESASAQKKIEFVDTNNYFPQLPPVSAAADATTTHELTALRQYVLSKASFDSGADPDVIMRALEWVSTQWEHDGMNEPPPGATALDILKAVHNEGQHFRCVEYGQVLSQLLTSFGYVARRISMRSADAAYGGTGSGHVATEVWSNNLRKWIFVDPQFSIYPVHNGEFLNFYDMYRLKKEGRFAEIEFKCTNGYQKHLKGEDPKKYSENYREFLSHYFGYMGVPVTIAKKNKSLLLELEGISPYLTFQGTQSADVVFTRQPEHLYYEPNRTLVLFEYKNKESSQKLYARLGIKTEQDFEKKMSQFDVKPDYILSLENWSPRHTCYEYRMASDGRWTKLNGSTLPWSLNAGLNELQVRSVNWPDLPGPTTFIKIKYQ